MDVSSTEHDFSSGSQRAPSPDLFSSEDEESYKPDDETQPSPVPSLVDPEVRKKESMLELESARLQRLMSLLQGVPPPPSVTIPQITLNEVLQKLTENSKLVKSPTEEPVASLWKPTSSLEEVKKTEWPLIRNIVYHDMHFNLCTASEDIEHISMKLNERYIGAETSTWCNAVTSQPSSAKKRQRRSLGNASPGCRLSHLARRRQTFSSASIASIAQLSSVAGSGTACGAPATASRRRLLNGGSAGQRCIMVEIKKTDKNKRVKTNPKAGQSKIPLPESVPKPAPQPQVPVQATKRALFQSPEEHKRPSSALSQPCVPENQVQRSKRALWPSDGESVLNDNGKRTLDKSDSSNSQRSKMHCSDDRAPYSRLTRSLTFPLGNNSAASKASAIGSGNLQHNNSNDTSSNSAKSSTRRASDQGPSDGVVKIELSELHKRKLFWAISSALRSHNISRNHPDFTRLSSMLAYHYIEIRSNMAGPPPASTSEHMLKVVSSKAGEVIQAERVEKSENLGGNKVQKKEERSNRELFRDATASLNVRRSLCVPLTSTTHQLSEDKPKATKKVPSARKSLSFDAIDPKFTAGNVNDDHVENGDGKFQLDSKGKDSNWRGNGENVPLTCAKRVSRSLFLSPKDDIKMVKKDACEQTNAPENPSSSFTNSDPSEIVEYKSDGNRKSTTSEICDVDEKPQQAGSDLSSIPSVSAASSTLEADNEASRTSEATNISEQANSNDAHNHLTGLDPNIPLKGSIVLDKNSAGASCNLKEDAGNIETSDCVPTRVLRETRERILRACYAQPVRRTRKSLSLSKRELRSSSSDSVEQDHTLNCQNQEKVSVPTLVPENCSGIVSTSASTMEPIVVLSPLKLPSPSVSAESNNTSKSTFGSPPFIADNTVTSAQSPFLGFPSKDDLNSSGGAADGTDNTAKVPDGSSEEGTCLKLDMEDKVITPLLEAGVLESSVCVGSGSSQGTDTDLTFRGRIESLKPSTSCENAINLELGMNLSANLLNMDENKEKSPVLEKWAERASRSAQKSSLELPVGGTNDVTCDASTALPKRSENAAEESMLPWDESQMEAVSQCSTNVFEKFCSIFGPSSHQGNS